MKTRIHFEVLYLSKMILNYRKNFVESCTINFMMQTAVMGTENRSGLRFIFNLWIKIDMMSQVPWYSSTREPSPTIGFQSDSNPKHFRSFIAEPYENCFFQWEQMHIKYQYFLSGTKGPCAQNGQGLDFQKLTTTCTVSLAKCAGK